MDLQSDIIAISTSSRGMPSRSDARRPRQSQGPPGSSSFAPNGRFYQRASTIHLAPKTLYGPLRAFERPWQDARREQPRSDPVGYQLISQETKLASGRQRDNCKQCYCVIASSTIGWASPDLPARPPVPLFQGWNPANGRRADCGASRWPPRVSGPCARGADGPT